MLWQPCLTGRLADRRETVRDAWRQAGLYFGLVIILTLPIWGLGAAFDFQLLPGLPVAALAVFCPTLAAAGVALRQGGGKQVRALFGRVLDAGNAGWRLLPIILINPALFGLAFLVSRFLGTDIPDPAFSAMQALALTALFLPSAILEEIGWTGFALDRLQTVVSPLLASLGLGLFWALWHYPALLEVGRAPAWIAWWTVWTVSSRVIMVWLYNNAGRSVFALAAYHASSNLCWQLYPVNGSWFDPRISGLVTLGLAAALTAWAVRGSGRRSA